MSLIKIKPRQVIEQNVTSISAAECRKMLLTWNLEDSHIRAILETIPDELERKSALIDWEFQTVILIDNPLVQKVKASLGKSDEELQQAFNEASKK